MENREGIKRLNGDGLSVKMESNSRILEVTGDGCKITLTKNCGSVRVVGDGCRVKIKHNVGDIVYTGDDGRVLLGPKSSKDRVKYVGVGGKVSFDSEPKKRTSSSPGEETKESKIILKNYLAVERDQERAETKRSSTEVKNNLWNERKEAADSKAAGKKREKERKNAVFVTTRAMTCDEARDMFEVEKWFVAPATVVRSFVNNVPTITVRERRSRMSPAK